MIPMLAKIIECHTHHTYTVMCMNTHQRYDATIDHKLPHKTDLKVDSIVSGIVRDHTLTIDTHHTYHRTLILHVQIDDSIRDYPHQEQTEALIHIIHDITKPLDIVVEHIQNDDDIENMKHVTISLYATPSMIEKVFGILAEKQINKPTIH